MGQWKIEECEAWEDNLLAVFKDHPCFREYLYNSHYRRIVEKVEGKEFITLLDARALYVYGSRSSYSTNTWKDEYPAYTIDCTPMRLEENKYIDNPAEDKNWEIRAEVKTDNDEEFKREYGWWIDKGRGWIWELLAFLKNYPCFDGYIMQSRYAVTLKSFEAGELVKTRDIIDLWTYARHSLYSIDEYDEDGNFMGFHVDCPESDTRTEGKLSPKMDNLTYIHSDH